MTKRAVLCFIAAIVAAAVGGAANADQLSDVKTRKQILCGVTDILDPFSFLDPATNRVAGYDVEMCAAIARRLGVAIEYKRLPLAARIPELMAGNVDLLAAGLGYSRQRAEQIAFSHVYHISQHMLLGRKDGRLKTSADAADARIGYIKGSSAQGVLAGKFPKATLVETTDGPTGYQALLKGEIDAFAASEILLTRFKNRPDANGALELLEPALAEEPWAIGVRRNEPAILDAINVALNDVEASGEAQALWDKWLGAGSSFKMKRGFKIAPVKP